MSAAATKDEERIEVEVHTLAEMPLAAGTLDRASIDSQIATAKQYPRSLSRALKEAETLATQNEEVAESMYYVLPRAGKDIEGPSARLAEVMVYSMGNMRAETDIVEVGRRFVTAMGTCFDLERNFAVRVRVHRRITDKHGKRYNDDMIGVTCNAAMSIALRNAVFKVVPQSVVQPVYQAARLTSAGKGKTLEAKRSGAVGWFAEQGAKPEQVFKLLGVQGLDDIGVDHIIRLKGIANAIKEGETTIELVFNPPKQSGAATALDEALAGGDAK